MTVQDDISTVLKADLTIMAILTGGVYEQDEVGEISRQDTAAAFDSNREIKPCVLIAEGTELPAGPYDHTGIGYSVRTPINIFFYERSGYTNIVTAMARAFSLLAGQKVGSATWRLEYDSSIKNQRDNQLEASLGVMRLMAVRLRS